ncbi:hypothetical protein LSUB1_G005402 [Lachnellula subtilissima]|uniref:DUF7907 domain-containing protein n=1 Tax=Lachnellula subtilissima TaxID=602034 RepID=A0A8H8RXH9_9HELO|nr:hypothetical protein LSUB1_G005402 [Lachnellula subtilissima]
MYNQPISKFQSKRQHGLHQSRNCSSAAFNPRLSSTNRHPPQYPQQTSTESFTLIANVTSGDLSPSIQNWAVTSYHTGAGMAYAVLAAETPRIFYANGTAEDLSFNRGNVLSDEGTPPTIPAGIVLGAASSATDSISINDGLGTAGVGITRGPDPIAKLFVPGGQGFYACEQVPVTGGSSAVMLFEKQDETPAGCADVVLLPQCSAGSGATHPTPALSGCYVDVAGIDWSVYYSS